MTFFITRTPPNLRTPVNSAARDPCNNDCHTASRSGATAVAYSYIGPEVTWPIYKNGTIVSGGQVFYDDTVIFLKLETTYNNTNIETYLPQLISQTITGANNDINAIIVSYDIKTATTPTTIYIKYTTGSGSISTYQAGEILSCAAVAGISFRIQNVAT